MRLESFGAFPIRIDDLANRIDHGLGLLIVDVVAAVGFRDVLCARHGLRQILLRRLLRVVEAYPKSGGVSAGNAPEAMRDRI